MTLRQGMEKFFHSKSRTREKGSRYPGKARTPWTEKGTLVGKGRTPDEGSGKEDRTGPSGVDRVRKFHARQMCLPPTKLLPYFDLR